METQNHADFGAIIPAFLDEYPLDPFEFRLFARIQRRSGRRECFESLPNMAKGCHMSLGKARLAFRVLAECKIISVQNRATEGKTYLCTINPIEYWVPQEQVEAIRKRLAPTKSDKGTESDTPIKSDTPTPIKSDTPTPIKSDTTPLSDLVPPPLSDLIPEGIPLNESINESQVILIPPTPRGGNESESTSVVEIPGEEVNLPPSTDSYLYSEDREEGGQQSKIEDQEITVQSSTSLSEQPTLSETIKPDREGEYSASPLRDNSVFVGSGNLAPDSKQRPFDQRKGTWKSIGSDPWMQSGSNVLPEFKQWLYQRHQRKNKGLTLSDAASEIRNDYARASDLWSEYQDDLARHQQAHLRLVQPIEHKALVSNELPVSAEVREQFRQKLLNKKVNSCMPKI
jgi:hypothetical protein